MTAPSTSDPSLKTRRLDHGKREVENECLASDLWKRLPEHLIEQILPKLPFSSLVRFCSVCKRWRDLILSSKISPRCTFDQGWLYYFSNEKLTVFSSSRGTWASASLQFLKKQFDLVDVVASAGGLLCFCTHRYGEFIVCNPITKCYKRLQMPCGNAWAAISGQPYMPKLYVNVEEAKDLLVGMILDPDTAHFQLIVGGIYPQLNGTALLYTSSNNSWKKVGDIPKGAHLSRSKPISCGRDIFFFFFYSLNRARVLKYDSEEQSWTWIRIPERQGFVSTVIEHRSKIVLITWPTGDLPMVEHFELQTSGPLRWMRGSPADFPSVYDSHPFPDRNLWDILGQGEQMFWIIKRCLESSGFEMGEIRVLCYNATTRLFVLSDWEDSGYAHDTFPNCQVFKPSLLPIM